MAKLTFLGEDDVDQAPDQGGERKATLTFVGEEPEGFVPLAEQSFVESVGNFVSGAAQSVRSLVTGEGRIAPEDVDRGEVRLPSPTIGERLFGEDADRSGLTFDQLTKVSTVLATVPGEKAKADIIKKIVPGTKSRIDKFGNVLIRFPEGSGFEFLNRPGASFNDLDEAVGQLIQFLPAGRVLRGANLAPRATAVGAASGATSVAQDIGATAAGSEQGIDFERAAITALGGALGEGAEQGIRTLLSFLPRGRALGLDEVRGLAQRAGLDPQAIGQDFVDALNDITTRLSRQSVRQTLRQGDDVVPPGTTAATGAALSRRFDVPLTQGETTRDFSQLAREEAMRAGARGETAQRITGGFRDETQVPRFQDATERLSQQGVPSSAPDTPIGTAERVREGLTRRASEADQAVDEVFQAARQFNASVTGDSARRLASGVDQVLVANNRVVDAQLTPATMKARQFIRSLAPKLPKQPKPIGFVLGEAQPQPRPVGIPLSRIEVTRRKINQLFDTAANKTDRGNLTIIKRAFDRWVDDAIDNALFSGDPKALDLLKRARAARAKFGELFEQRGTADSAGRVIQRILDDPDLSNVQVSNWLFGTSRLGQTDQSVRIANRLVRIFGADSAEITAIRQANVRSLFYNPRTGQPLVSVDGGAGFQRIRSNLDEFLDGRGSEYARILHTPGQLAELRSFRDLVNRMILPRQATNPSGSGFANARAFIDGFNKVLMVMGLATGSPAGPVVAGGIRSAAAITNKRQAKRAVAGSIHNAPVPPSFPLGQAAANLGAANAEQNFGQFGELF